MGAVMGTRWSLEAHSKFVHGEEHSLALWSNILCNTYVSKASLHGYASTVLRPKSNVITSVLICELNLSAVARSPDILWQETYRATSGLTHCDLEESVRSLSILPPCNTACHGILTFGYISIAMDTTRARPLFSICILQRYELVVIS